MNNKQVQSKENVDEKGKNTLHYHVINSMHGYIPDTNDVYRTKTEARHGLKELVSIFRDSGEHFTGSIKYGCFENTNGNSYISIEDCAVPDCLEELEGVSQ